MIKNDYFETFIQLGKKPKHIKALASQINKKFGEESFIVQTATNDIPC